MPRLGVNIDHIATVRQARRTFEPDPVAGALAAEMAGAHQITLHVREDRRHVQERDLELVCKVCRTRINLEMAAVPSMLEIALRYHPDEVTLVPEKREEVTTEGGLDVVAGRDKISNIKQALDVAGITVSAFIDPETAQVEVCRELGFTVIEFHTGKYADAPALMRQAQLDRLAAAAKLATSMGIVAAAGHGLTYYNVRPVVNLNVFEEFNIGHSIMARAIIVGLDRAVREMLELVCTPQDRFDPAHLFRNQVE